MSKDAEIEIAVNNNYFFSNVFTDDLLIRTTDNSQRIHLGTLQTKIPALTIHSNVVYANSNMYVARRLGVNKTSNAEYELDVEGNMHITGSIFQNGVPYTTGTSTWASNVANDITYYNRGVVGIGTSNPRALFHIVGSNNAVLLQNSNATGVAINFQDPLGTGSVRFQGGSVQLFTGNTEVAKTNSTNFVIPSGFLGVNTANPSRTLHVDGISYFASNVGIGTSNPSGLLDVSGSIYVGKGDNNSSNTTNGIYFKGVKDDVQTSQSNYPHAGIVHRQYDPQKAELVIYSARGVASNEGPDKVRMVAGAIHMQTYKTSLDQSTLNTDFTPVESHASLSTALYINSNGYVGVGTSEPNAVLDVSGEASVAGDLLVTSNVRAYRLEMQGITIKKNYGGETNFSPYTFPGISNENAGILSIFTPTDLLRIFTNYSNEIVRIYEDKLALNKASSNLTAYLNIYSTDDPTRLADFVNTVESNVAEVRLHNEQANDCRVVLSQPLGTTVYGINDNASNVYLWSCNASASFTIGTNSLERIRVTPSGLIGIGTSTPSNIVDVEHISLGMKVNNFTPQTNLFQLANYMDTRFLINSEGVIGINQSNLQNMNTKLHLQVQETLYATTCNVPKTSLTQGSKFGQAIALNENKDRIVIGAPSENPNGQCYVYTQQNGSWVEVGLPAPTSGSGGNFGISVAMSSSGNRVLVGNPSSDTAYIFDYDTGTQSWQETESFTASNSFGCAVSMSSNGQVIAIGASNGAGSVVVYRYQSASSNWDSYVYTGSSNSRLGTSIDISSSGDTIVVGAPKANNDLASILEAGAVVTYRWNGSSNAYLSNVVFPLTSYASEQFGATVSLSTNGMFLAASGRNFDSTGRAVVFTYDGFTWQQTGNIVNSDVLDTNYTSTMGPPNVRVFNSNKNVLVGWKYSPVTTSSNQGKAIIYRSTSAGYEKDRTIFFNNSTSNAQFSSGMAISVDGSRIVLGAPTTFYGNVTVHDVYSQNLLTINQGSNAVLYVQHDAKVGVGLSNPQATLHVQGNALIAPIGSSNSFIGGPFFKQSSWDTPQARHVMSYDEIGRGVNAAGTLYIHAANKSMNPSSSKIGNAVVSFLKRAGADVDIFIMNTHKYNTLNTFNIASSNNYVVVDTDADCAISWTSIGSH